MRSTNIEWRGAPVGALRSTNTDPKRPSMTGGYFNAARPPCISAAPAALDRYLAALPAISLIPFAPFAKAMA